MKKVEIDVFEPGDIVLFQEGENGFKSHIGMILKHKENGNYSILTNYRSIYKYAKPSQIVPISEIETVRDEITSYYEGRIASLQSQIRKATQEEKDTERIKKYEDLKNRIIETAQNLINYKDNDDFENKLKAIADMKRQIFSIELECSSNIRKENGRIKREIEDEISARDTLLKRICDENIKKAFDF